MSHVGFYIFYVKSCQAFYVVKVYQDVGAFSGSDFDPRYIDKTSASVELNRSADIIMIGDGNADVQFPGSFYNRTY